MGTSHTNSSLKHAASFRLRVLVSQLRDASLRCSPGLAGSAVKRTSNDSLLVALWYKAPNDRVKIIATQRQETRIIREFSLLFRISWKLAWRQPYVAALLHAPARAPAGNSQANTLDLDVRLLLDCITVFMITEMPVLLAVRKTYAGRMPIVSCHRTSHRAGGSQ